MTRVGSSVPGIPVLFQLDEFVKSGSSFLSKFNFNWERGILIGNTALLVAGIAYGFFMRLPLLTASVAAYGIFYFALHTAVKNSRPSSIKLYELQSQLEVEEEQNKKLSQKLEANLHGRDLAENLHLQAEEDEIQYTQLERRSRGLREEVNRLREQRDELQRRRRV